MGRGGGEQAAAAGAAKARGVVLEEIRPVSVSVGGAACVVRPFDPGAPVHYKALRYWVRTNKEDWLDDPEPRELELQDTRVVLSLSDPYTENEGLRIEVDGAGAYAGTRGYAQFVAELPELAREVLAALVEDAKA